MIAHKTVRVRVVEVESHVTGEVEDAVHEPLGCGENLTADVAQGITVVLLEACDFDLVISDETETLHQVKVIVQRQAPVRLHAGRPGPFLPKALDHHLVGGRGLLE